MTLPDPATLWESPFTVGGRLVMIAGALLGVFFALQLVSRRRLTMAYAMVWIGVFVGFAALVAFPPLLSLVAALLDTASTDGALRFLALSTVVGFLVFFSVRVSVLTHRLEDLAQRVALMEYGLEERIRRATESPREGSPGVDRKPPRASA